MTRKKLKFELVANENARATKLKKIWSALIKKVTEFTILCDVKLCVITYSPNDAAPMVWPSVEKAGDLIRNFNALPDFEKMRKAMTLESFMTGKISKVEEKLRKLQKKNMEHEIDKLMVQLRGDRRMDDLDVNELKALLSFSKDKIMKLRKRVGSVEHRPLRDPFETQSEEPRTTTNDGFVIGGGQDAERARNTIEGDKTHYLMDGWVYPSPEPLNPLIHQQIGIGMGSYNADPNPRSYLPFQGSYPPYQGSGISGNPNLQMHPNVPPVMPFHGMLGSVSQPLQHHDMNMDNNPIMAMSQPMQNPNLEMHPIPPVLMPFHGMLGSVSQPLHHHDMNMNNNPIMAMNQPMQNPFDAMSGEERNNFNIGGSQMATNDGLRQEPPPPPPPNEATAGEGNADATSFDTNRDWPGTN
ncbi:hypothetical protein EUTSA_v10027229mg [Eutrema salsugineum]|uniref:MADS-box domain-containing protein n=1 Tax=Eutrema salsugineum TaxID=72664 RepID=V4LXK5_EUTSA|nr:uncharacterized protein LOC18029575 [Eutrema salsugineum]ESQ55415.1 hypothetical protein EUTSA_v10027229mg [Eutrema salsugineum]